MKLKYILPLMLVAMFALSMFGATTKVSAAGYPGWHGASDWAPNVPFHCANQNDESNVTQTLNLAEGTADDQLKFNTTTLVANKDACVKLVVRNLATTTTHDFVIEKVGGSSNDSAVDADLSKAQINHVDLDIANSTDDLGFGPGLNVFYIATPSVDAQFTYFCEQPGHETAGMKGTLYVGAGPASPGFEIVPALFAIISTVGIVSFYRKRN